MAAQPVTARDAALTSCPLCGLEYVPGGVSCRERGCPVALGSCATTHCPRCGYTMPDEERSVAARFVRRLFGPRDKKPAGTLTALSAGSSAIVERLEGEPGSLARLTAQGLAPGVAIHVLQRTPTYVIELGHTTLAIERRVADGIFVRTSAQIEEPPRDSRSSTASGSRVTKPSP